MTNSVDIINRTLAQIGTRSQITSLTDGSTEALYADLLYNDLRDFMLREGDYDFSMATAVATPFGSPAPTPWVYIYNYPTGALRIRQAIPSVYNPLDPQAVEWNVLYGSTVLLIGSKTSIASFNYTRPTVEDLWDSIFTEAFVRLLGSALAFALENRIEASKEKLSEALSFSGIANMRDS